MAIFFVTPYTKYYEELNASTDIVGKASTLSGNVSSLIKSVEKLQSQLESSDWKELGQEQLVTVSVPALKERLEKFQASVSNGLQVACTESINTLLPLVTTLKEKDELYEKKLDELNSLKEPSPKYETKRVNGKDVDTGELTSEYKKYEKKKKEERLKIMETTTTKNYFDENPNLEEITDEMIEEYELDLLLEYLTDR